VPEVASLTQSEAVERAALIDVTRYDIVVDMRGLLDGDTLESVSTIAFACREPGAETFLDCVADVRWATLNDRPLDLADIADGRIPLRDLAADNVVVVSAAQSDTASSAGILRTVDPSDKLVYVWTSFEPDAARRVWACFDQPDLKAPHGFTVLAPEAWLVTSNSAPGAIEDDPDGGRRWEFPDTPPLSTYVVVVNAGPFHEIREERGGHSLGLFCRQSLRSNLERDAAHLFELTAQGLAFFGEQFGQPFPQERYDQVFVPNMGGAMENWGCVTWTDAVLHRSPPTHGQREHVANVLLHEMAHMWFGDLVTMRWWDDLWLNEAFASWAANWAEVNATSYTDAEATFLAGLKLEGYRADMGPATHPIRGEVPDVDQAMANFDAVTYIKGQSTLRQLAAYVGEETFVEGLRSYFRAHAWGNARLDDLISAVGDASGRDLSDWTTAWLDQSGTDTLALVEGEVMASGPAGEEPRRHRIDIGSFTASDEGLVRVATTAVETTGVRTPVPGLPGADLHLVNDGDLTFAAVRTDEASLQTLLERAGDLPDPLSRALGVSTAWDMLVKGELAADDLLTCVLDVLESERSPAVVEPFLGLAKRAADQWTPISHTPRQLSRLVETAAALAEHPDHRAAALRTLAAAASEPEDFDLLEDAAAGDTDLAWRVLVRRAALGSYDAAAVEALEARDPDPDAWVRALGVTAARPDRDAKDEVWAQVFDKRSVPAGAPLRELARCFWRPVQHDLLLPYAESYLDEVVRLAGGGMLAVMSLARMMFPTVGDGAFLERARQVAAEPDQDPTIRTTVLSGADTLERMLRARG
jgi:aminopeptidase N